MKTGVVEVPHGFWRTPQVAALCERLGTAAGAFVLMAEAYALESLPDGDFGRASRETLASRCWFCPATEAGTILAALADLGFLVNGKLAGWDAKVAQMHDLREKRRRAGAAGGRAKAKSEPADAPREVLSPMGAPAGGKNDLAGATDDQRTPFIQAQNGVSGAGAGGNELVKDRETQPPTAPVAPTPAPVNPLKSWLNELDQPGPRLTKAEHTALLRGEDDGRPADVVPGVLFGPLPPWRFPKDRDAIREQIDDLLKDANRIKERALSYGREMNPQETADFGAYQKRILALKALLKGVVPPEPAPASSPVPKPKNRKPRK